MLQPGKFNDMILWALCLISAIRNTNENNNEISVLTGWK